MNIAVLNDDGYKAKGYSVLLDALVVAFPNAKVLGLSTVNSASGKSMSVSTKLKLDDLSSATHTKVKLATDVYVYDLFPADLAYLVISRPDLFYSVGDVDAVFSGINHGANVGNDVLHSGTLGVCYIVNRLVGIPCVAVSQSSPNIWWDSEAEKKEFEFVNVPLFFRKWLSIYGVGTPGVIYNINLPFDRHREVSVTKVAVCSRFRYSKADQDFIRTTKRGKETDIYALENGNVSVSEIVPFLS